MTQNTTGSPPPSQPQTPRPTQVVDYARSGSPTANTFLGRFTVLRGAPRELWVVFTFQLVAILAYQAMNMTFKLWLSHDLGFSDTRAGFIVGTWAVLFTLFSVLVGSLADAVGLRRAFFLGVWVCILARVVITFATFKWLAVVAGMLPLAVGEAMSGPVLVASVRRFSNSTQRTIAFSIYYAMMNVGFLLANLLFDRLRSGLGEYGFWTVPLLHLHLTTYRTLFLVSLLIEFTLLPLLWFGLRSGVEATDEGVKITPEQPKYPHERLLTASWLSTRDALRNAGSIFAGLWRQPGFYKFLAFLGFAAFVRLVFVHMYYTFPTFGIRELGLGAPVGRLSSVNNILIIIFVPLVGAFSQKIPAYRMVTVGTVIGAASVFIMVLPSAWFVGVANIAPAQWAAHRFLGLVGTISPWVMMIFLFQVFLSIGEAIYSPRTYEYAACIAPKGQEASYMSMSYLPYLLAKAGAATSSGLLLGWFCPETGPRHSQILWLIIALTAAIGPLGLIIFRRWIRVPEAGRGG